jgi:hypothetical protein
MADGFRRIESVAVGTYELVPGDAHFALHWPGGMQVAAFPQWFGKRCTFGAVGNNHIGTLTWLDPRNPLDLAGKTLPLQRQQAESLKSER